MNDEQLTQRMRAASEAIEMPDAAQARHLEAISAALTAAGSASDGAVVTLSSAGTARRRRLVASVVAAAMIAPAGLAAASEGSVPGDALYPVKQISERVLVLFDTDVIARHRIEEIEALETAGRFDPDLYEDAQEALAELGEDHPLWERLASSSVAEDDTDDEDEAVIADDDRSEFEPDEPTEVGLELPDGQKATLTVAGGELLAVDPPAGWMITELDDDEATLRSDGFEVGVELHPDGSISTEITDLRDDDSPSITDDSVGDDSEESDGESGSEEDGSEVSDDDVSEDAATEPSTPSDEETDHSDGSESGSDDEPADEEEDPADEEGDPSDDEPSEDA